MAFRDRHPLGARVKAPAFQWYPGDHRRDTALQACSFEARALWRETLDLMHDGDPYGHLTAGGIAITDAQLAQMIPGVSATKIRRWLAELEERKVFSRTDTGVIYSRRMVRDEEKRRVRAAGGIKSLGNPNVPRPKDERKDTFGLSLNGSPAVSSLQSASSQKEQLFVKSAKSNGVGVLEAGELVQRILRLADRHVPSGVKNIPRPRVAELGPDVLRAYEAVGGSSRFIAADAKTIAFLYRDFGRALEEARAAAGTSADARPHVSDVS